MEANDNYELYLSGFKVAEFKSKNRLESYISRLKEQYRYDRGIYSIFENGIIQKAFRYSGRQIYVPGFETVPIDLAN